MFLQTFNAHILKDATVLDRKMETIESEVSHNDSMFQEDHELGSTLEYSETRLLMPFQSPERESIDINYRIANVC